MILRSTDNAVFAEESTWASFNPILPTDLLLVSTDTGGIKISDGLTPWSELSYTTGLYIGSKPLSTDAPINNQIIWFNGTSDQFEYKLQGAIDTISNWFGNTSTYPTFALLVETASGGVPTGRFKIADGITTYPSLPYFGGIHLYNQFSTGITNNSIEWNGYEWVNKDYWDKDDIPYPTVAQGYILHDNLQWGTVPYVNTPITTVINNIATFGDTTGDTLLDSGISVTTFPTSSPGETFQVNSNSNGPKLKNVSGELDIRNSSDTSYADLRAANIRGDFASFTTGEFASVTTTTLYLNGSEIPSTDDVIVYSIIFGG